MPPVHVTCRLDVTHVISYALSVASLNASTVSAPPLSRYAFSTACAKTHEVSGPTVSEPPHDPPVDSGETVPPGTLFAAFFGRGLFVWRLIVILVEPGVAPGALPITSIVVLPACRVAVPVNTPLPTAAGWPWICTTASAGSTVPRTVTLLASMTLPLVGEVTVTMTVPELTVLVVVDPHPHTASTGAKTNMPPNAALAADVAHQAPKVAATYHTS